MINYNENEAGNEKINHKDTTQIDLTEAELKKSLAYKKSVYFSQFSSNFLEQTKETRI